MHNAANKILPGNIQKLFSTKRGAFSSEGRTSLKSHNVKSMQPFHVWGGRSGTDCVQVKHEAAGWGVDNRFFIYAYFI